MKEIQISDVPLYECELSLLIGGEIWDVIKLLKERHKDPRVYSWNVEFKWEEDANTTNAYAFHVNAPFGNGERFYIWMAEPTINLLAHETFHLTGDMLFTRGFEYCYGSEEGFAYLHGWLFDRIYNLIYEKPVLKE